MDRQGIPSASRLEFYGIKSESIQHVVMVTSTPSMVGDQQGGAMRGQVLGPEGGEGAGIRQGGGGGASGPCSRTRGILGDQAGFEDH